MEPTSHDTDALVASPSPGHTAAAQRTEVTGRGRAAPFSLLVAAAIPSLLVLIPIGYTVFDASAVGPGEAASLILRPLVGELLFNTLSLAAAATLLCAILATTLAWFVERTRLPGRSVWAVFVVVPLAIPPFATSYAWVSVSPALQDFAGALLVVTMAYYPLIYLPVSAALRGMDPTLEETARSLGESAWGSFWRVVFPQLRPALLGGMLLVALHTLVEFGAFALLRFRTFTTEIYAEYRIGFGGPQASLLATILILLCLACLAAELSVRRGSFDQPMARGVRRRPSLHDLGRSRGLVFLGFVTLGTASVGVPLATIGFWLTQHASAATTPAVASSARLFHAASTSIGLGMAGAALTVLIALPLGYLSARHHGPFVTVLERAAYLAQGVPGIVVALAFVSISVRFLHPLYQSTALLALAYAIVFLPLALVNVRAAALQSPRHLDEAGRCLGLSWRQTAWRVTLPLMRPGLGGAAALVFVSVVTELTTTLLLAPIGTRTLATEVWSNTSSVAFAAAAPYAAVMVILSLASTWFLARRLGASSLLGA